MYFLLTGRKETSRVRSLLRVRPQLRLLGNYHARTAVPQEMAEGERKIAGRGTTGRT